MPACLCDERHIGREAAEVAAAGEHLLVRRRRARRSARRRRRGRRERREQVVEQRVRERVARLGLIEARSSRHRRRPRSARSRGHGGATPIAVTHLARGEVGSPTVHFTRNEYRRTPWPPPTSASPITPQARTSSSPTSTSSCASRSAASPPRSCAARGGVGGDDVPRLGVHAHGRARLPRPDKPERVRRPGRRLLHDARARRGDRPRGSGGPGDGRRGPHRHGDAADPRLRHRGAEAGLPGPGDQGEKIPCLGITEPDAGSDVAGIKTRARCATATSTSSTARRPTSPTAHRADVSCSSTKTDPDAGHDGFTLFLVDMDLPGVIREKRLEKTGHARVRHGAARLPGRPRARRARSSAQVGKGFYHIMWELQGERLIGAAGSRRRRPAVLRPDAAVRQGARGVRPADRPVPGHHATSSPRWRRRSRPRASSSTRRAWRFADGEYPVREISMAKLLRRADRRRGRRRVHPDPRRRRLHGRVRRRARLARPAPEPHRRAAPTRSCSRSSVEADRAVVSRVEQGVARPPHRVPTTLSTKTRRRNGSSRRQGGDRHRLGPRHRPRDGRAAGSSTARRSLINDLDGDVAAADRGRDRRRDRPSTRGDLTKEGAARRARPDGDRRLGQDRHHRQQRRLHARRADPQDERRLVPEDARHPPRRAVPGHPRRGAAPARAGQGRARARARRSSARSSTSPRSRA